MRKNQVYTGDIKKCTSYEPYLEVGGSRTFGYVITGINYQSEIFKKKTILIKLKNGKYVDIDSLNSIMDYIKIYKDNLLLNSEIYNMDLYTKLSGLLLNTSPSDINSLYVDNNSIKPYFEEDDKKHISVLKLKKERKLKKQKKT